MSLENNILGMRKVVLERISCLPVDEMVIVIEEDKYRPSRCQNTDKVTVSWPGWQKKWKRGEIEFYVNDGFTDRVGRGMPVITTYVDTIGTSHPSSPHTAAAAMLSTIATIDLAARKLERGLRHEVIPVTKAREVVKFFNRLKKGELYKSSALCEDCFFCIFPNSLVEEYLGRFAIPEAAEKLTELVSRYG